MSETIAVTYDSESSKNWSDDPRINELFLRNVQNYMNDRLKAHGFVFLNEVFVELSLPRTRQGQLVGWLRDSMIEFGIGPSTAGTIELKFNVDGEIIDKI